MCKDAPSDELEAAIKNAIGSADAKFYVSACTPVKEFKSNPSEISEASSRYEHLAIFMVRKTSILYELIHHPYYC